MHNCPSIRPRAVVRYRSTTTIFRRRTHIVFSPIRIIVRSPRFVPLFVRASDAILLVSLRAKFRNRGSYYTQTDAFTRDSLLRNVMLKLFFRSFFLYMFALMKRDVCEIEIKIVNKVKYPWFWYLYIWNNIFQILCNV